MSKSTSPKAPQTKEEFMSSLAKLDAERSALLEKYRLQYGAANLPRTRLNTIIREHLLTHGPMPLEQLVNDLSAAGHDLGKYPRRTVKNCVAAQTCRLLFSVVPTKRGSETVEIISLRTALDTPYLNERSRQQMKVSRSRVN